MLYIYAKWFINMFSIHSKLDGNKTKYFVLSMYKGRKTGCWGKRRENNNLGQLTKTDLYFQSEKMTSKKSKYDYLTYVSVIAYALKRKNPEYNVSLVIFHYFDTSREMMYEINFWGWIFHKQFDKLSNHEGIRFPRFYVEFFTSDILFSLGFQKQCYVQK